jgi:hypothetical protein
MSLKSMRPDAMTGGPKVLSLQNECAELLEP